MPRCPNPRCQTDYPPGTTQCTNPFCQCLLPEAVVAGRYRIETLIGMGGMGAVYRASDTFEMQQIALKILTLVRSTMDMAVAVERFRREARYAHQLKHKNIVPVLNFGQDGQLLYITMPLITGGTLKALLKAEQPLPLRQAQAYLNDLAAAIDAIHNHPQQIIHRDIKPSNLLIHQDDGRLVVADFGIARAMQQEKPLTQRGWSLGTEHYIAPEQEHGNAQPTSDIYAMGVVAYQMFTGLLPFQAVVRSRAAELPPPSALNAALPTTVDAIILRAMEIEPAKRYSSGKAFAEALNDALTPDNDIWSAPTISDTMVATSNANVIVRVLMPQNPCSQCGRENRSTSRFCRHCGHTLGDASPFVTDAYPVGYVSDIGQNVPENEDMLLIVQGLCVTLPLPPRPFGLFAVADGLRGTHGKSAGGHEASRLAIETVADVLIPLLATPAPTPSQTGSITPGGGGQSTHTLPRLPRRPTSEAIVEQWVRDAVRQANQVIYHCNADYDTNMASTLTLAVTYKQHVYIASVGDSRAYHYSPSRGLQSLAQQTAANLGDSESKQQNEADSRAKRTQYYLGQNYRTPIDLLQLEIEAGDILLLCTDGLWHTLSDERIQELLSQGGDPQKLAGNLVAAANIAGGEGNVSAIVVRAQ
ncbi:MAG: hypothetical protein NVS2B12_28620 [Ktedonobacteraceae bacterium]